MKKTFLSKYYHLCSCVLLICVLIVGSVLVIISDKFYRNDRCDDIENSMQLVASNVSKGLTPDKIYTPSDIKAILNQSKLYTGSDFMIFNNNGGFLISSDGKINIDSIGSLSHSFISKANTDVYTTIGYTDIAPNQMSICCIKKIPLTDSDFIYILSITNGEDINNHFEKLFWTFGIISAIILIIALFIFIRTSKEMINPITDITTTAERFIKGDTNAVMPDSKYDEFQKLASCYNEMAKIISTTENAHKNFITNVSHEFKTPMTIIGGFINGILDGTILEENQKHYLVLVSDEINRLSRLVKTLLTVSKYESSDIGLTYSEINITEIIIETLLIFENKIEEKHVSIEGLESMKTIIEADSDLIRQLLYNIIENAVKFVDENGAITISVSCDDDFALIKIRNTGDGLSEEEMPRIFDRFYKADESRGIDAAGIGLGLSICRSIINLHNGIIAVKSIEGQYTEFDIKLPLRKISKKVVK